MLCLLFGKRYQSIRRTMTGRGSRDFHSANSNQNNNNSTAITTTAESQSPVTDTVDGSVLSTPTQPLPTTQPQLGTTVVTTTTTVTTTTPTSAVVSPSRVILDLPAVRFLTRTDFFNLMHMNDEALAQYNGSSSLKHMVTKIRREGQHSVTTAFERYQHNRDLVSLINRFAETNKELPSGKAILFSTYKSGKPTQYNNLYLYVNPSVSP